MSKGLSEMKCSVQKKKPKRASTSSGFGQAALGSLNKNATRAGKRAISFGRSLDAASQLTHGDNADS